MSKDKQYFKDINKIASIIGELSYLLVNAEDIENPNIIKALEICLDKVLEQLEVIRKLG